MWLPLDQSARVEEVEAASDKVPHRRQASNYRPLVKLLFTSSFNFTKDDIFEQPHTRGPTTPFPQTSIKSAQHVSQVLRWRQLQDVGSLALPRHCPASKAELEGQS